MRRFTRERPAAPATTEHCELCSAVIPREHRHLLELSQRTLLCTCAACAILFSNERAGKYHLVPQRYFLLSGFAMTDEQWNALLIPVNMAYIFYSTQAREQTALTEEIEKARTVMAFYPGPAGAIESLLDLHEWKMLAEENPIVQTMEPDVEALLINRIASTHEYYLVPIDTCYHLVGLIRTYWRGFSGGEAVWTAITDFFRDLRARAHTEGGKADARAQL
ncbi:hypothetical protein EPA93_43895 [Ktedonosporobacter rubrisoli]|uniref:Uncharacterized protein n=1 Tax=Ktedonosporobacter rubrisoli TaxID=2509675 RepID=A0A4V0Z0M8_KTERU|nr:hypothetical protein EPA93_43895 [Ktedonosporobacter rubrisoli]